MTVTPDTRSMTRDAATSALLRPTSFILLKGSKHICWVCKHAGHALLGMHAQTALDTCSAQRIFHNAAPLFL